MNAQVTSDSVICRGETIILETQGNYEFYRWSSNPSIIWNLGFRAAVRPLSDQQYSVIGRRRLDEELVTDGDFQASTPQFTSDLLINSNGNFSSGSITVVSNSGEVSGDHDACPDLTGVVSDSFLAVHAIRGQAPKIWCQDVAVQEGITYGFGATVATLKSEHIGTFAFLIDGVQIGRPAPPEFVTCTWRGYLRDYASLVTGTVQACITIESPTSGDALAAVDKITFRPYDAPFFDTIDVTVNEVPDTSRLEVFVCAGSEYEFEGEHYAGDQTHEIVYPHQSFCDSIFLLTVLEVTSFSTTISEEHCTGHIVDLKNGEFVALTADTSFSTIYSSIHGCDSVVERSYRVLNSRDIELNFDRGMCESNDLSVIATSNKWPNAEFTWPDNSTGPLSGSLPFDSNLVLNVSLPFGCNLDRPFLTPPPLQIPEVSVIKAPSCFATSDAVIRITTSITSHSEERSLHLFTPSGSERELLLEGSEIILNDLRAGDYKLVLKDMTCETQALFSLEPTNVQSLRLLGDTVLRKGQSTFLSIEGAPQSLDIDFNWSGPSFAQDEGQNLNLGRSQILRIPRAGQHVIRLKLDSFCIQEFTFSLNITDGSSSVFPSAFSPNGDGVNDIFRNVAQPYIERVEQFQVFNRWGNLISSNREAVWDGGTNGPGVFVYRAIIRFINGDSESYEGNVSLVR